MVPHKEAEFSSQSIMKAMEKFVTAVQEMDETILVPSRLMDLQVGDSGDSVAKTELGSSTDLFGLYETVNSVRKELLWGSESDNQIRYKAKPGHVRRPSNVSTTSLGSNVSDTDSETGLDSGIENEQETKPTQTQRLEENFRRHLYGLQTCLGKITDAANYLTKRYQNDIGGTV